MAIHFTTCNLCESMCGLRLTLEGNQITDLRGDPEDPHSHGHICPKAIGMKELLEDPDRLKEPVVRKGAGWTPVSWDEGLERAAAPIQEIQAKHGRNAPGNARPRDLPR